MNRVVDTSLYVFHIPRLALEHLQSFYDADVREATVEIFCRVLRLDLDALPLADDANTFTISCFQLPVSDGFSILISVGGTDYPDGDGDIHLLMIDVRQHWLEYAWNLRAGGAYSTVHVYRHADDLRPCDALLQSTTLQLVPNLFTMFP